MAMAEGDAFFDKQIPDCAKGGIHAGAKLGSSFAKILWSLYDHLTIIS
jgi:hypothetical protein